MVRDLQLQIGRAKVSSFAFACVCESGLIAAGQNATLHLIVWHEFISVVDHYRIARVSFPRALHMLDRSGAMAWAWAAGPGTRRNAASDV